MLLAAVAATWRPSDGSLASTVLYASAFHAAEVLVCCNLYVPLYVLSLLLCQRQTDAHLYTHTPTHVRSCVVVVQSFRRLFVCLFVCVCVLVHLYLVRHFFSWFGGFCVQQVSNSLSHFHSFFSFLHIHFVAVGFYLIFGFTHTYAHKRILPQAGLAAQLFSWWVCLKMLIAS